MTVQDGLAYFKVPLEVWRTRNAPKDRDCPGLAAICALMRVPPPPALTEVSDAQPLQARVCWGRWIADCPCGSASFVWLSTPLLWCPECQNKASEGKWRRVTLPRNWQMIETILSQRPDSRNQNWSPGETVSRLRAENRQHGVSP